MILDMAFWEHAIKKSNWYSDIIPKIKPIINSTKQEKEKKSQKEQIYSFFEQHLVCGDIALGNEIGVWDKERKLIDTIVIHHTANLPGMTLDRLSAIELVRLYAPYYTNPLYPQDEYIKGSAISSGHVRGGKQVFYPYHWIIKSNGKKERLLYDSEIGWHAGNWNVNCRSIAIVLDNNYETTKPSTTELEAIANLIKSNYSFVPKDRILGHGEINLRTTCPSRLFLSRNGQRGWKEDLLELI
jgi:hypothetical protein